MTACGGHDALIGWRQRLLLAIPKRNAVGFQGGPAMALV